MINVKLFFPTALVAAGLLAANSASAATLTGATVELEFYFPDASTLDCSNGTQVVGDDVEFPAGCGGFRRASVDITSSQVIARIGGRFSDAAFNGIVLSVLSGPTISGVTYNAAESGMGVTSSSFTASSMTFNFAGQGPGAAVFDISFGDPAVVPIPAGLPLLVAGLGALGYVGRRKSRTT